MRPALAALAISALTAVGACSDNAAGVSGDTSPRSPEPSGGAAASSSGGAPAPEQEVESDYEAPVATGKFVWVANPKSGRVAYVNASTLEVRTVDAGNGPTYLAAVPGQADDTAIVINVLSEDATLLKAAAGGTTTRSFKVARGANAWAFSADGRYAIAWADARKVKNAPRTEGFQDLTVMDLTSGAVTVLAVGYRPVAVGFAAGAPRAHAVTQDGVAIVDLSTSPPRVTKNVPISDNPLEDPGTRDVAVTPNGQLALVRRDGSAEVTVLSLDTGARAKVTLSGPATDLDLTDAGTRAVAVVRDKAQVAILPVPEIFQNPSTFTTVDVTGETIGSVALAPGGATGLLYTNASAVERLTVLRLGPPPEVRTVKLYSPVLAAFVAPDARHAVVVHDKTAGPSGSPGAFSLVPIGAEPLPAKIVATQAPPSAVAMTNDRAVVAERADTTKVYGAYLGRTPELMVERYALASPPIAVGVVQGAKRAFVAQEHPEGRITFIDLDTGLARTLTGFELASRVVDGSKP